MLVFDNNSEPLILDSIVTPTLTDHFWVLDLQMQDFTMAPLVSLEEIVGATVVVQIRGFQFPLPATWHMLVIDEETSELDVCEVRKLGGKDFHAMVYGPDHTIFETAVVSTIDFSSNFVNVGPLLNKHQMLCHPIGPGAWVNVAPSDTYNKYLKDIVAGDLVS